MTCGDGAGVAFGVFGFRIEAGGVVVVAGINVGVILVGVMLEELLAGGRSVEATQDAKLTVVEVGNARTIVSSVGTGIEGEDVGEESLGELGIEQRALGHNFFAI